MIASLLNFSGNERLFWSIANMDLHRRSVTQVFTTHSVSLTLYTLEPIPDNYQESWLQLHQQMHNDLNAVLGLSGNDFSSVDFNNKEELAWWLQLHFEEHRQQAEKLGITE